MIMANIVKVFFFATGAMAFAGQLSGRLDNSLAISVQIYGCFLLASLIDVVQQVYKKPECPYSNLPIGSNVPPPKCKSCRPKPPPAPPNAD